MDPTVIPVNLDDFELKIAALGESSDPPIARAAALLSIANTIIGAAWNPWVRERAWHVADRARVLADHLVEGDAEEKVFLWSAREVEAHALGKQSRTR